MITYMPDTAFRLYIYDLVFAVEMPVEKFIQPGSQENFEGAVLIWFYGFKPNFHLTGFGTGMHAGLSNYKNYVNTVQKPAIGMVENGF